MPKFTTQEEYIRKANKAHNNFYSYEKTVYAGVRAKVIVTCPNHGDFTVEASSHLTSKCMKCAKEKVALLYKLSDKEFIEKSNKSHSNKYDYSKVSYKNSQTKVVIGCPKHGDFSMLPLNHTKTKNPQGCPACGDDRAAEVQRKSPEQFILDSTRVHGDKFDYSATEYIGDKYKLNVICKEHGLFNLCASHHLQGQGCPKCSPNGYSVVKPGYLYVMLGNDNITKVGITNRNVPKRLRELNKHSGKEFKVHSTYYFEDGQLALNLENNTLDYLHSKYDGIDDKFNGSTECFKDVDLAELLLFIVPKAI